MEDQTNETKKEQTSAADPWNEVGRQFQALGETLGDALRATWEREDNRKYVREISDGLQSMVGEISRAVKDVIGHDNVENIKTEVSKTADTLISAGSQTVEEAKPHLMSALKQVNSELQKMIEKMDKEKKAETSETSETSETKVDQA